MDYHQKIRNLVLVGIACFFVVHTAYVTWVYFFSDYYPSERIGSLYFLTIYGAVIYAIVHDNKVGEHIYDTYDLGFLAWMFWPIFIPFYLFKSRGLIAFPILIILALVIFNEAIVDLVWRMVTPEQS